MLSDHRLRNGRAIYGYNWAAVVPLGVGWVANIDTLRVSHHLAVCIIVEGWAARGSNHLVVPARIISS